MKAYFWIFILILPGALQGEPLEKLAGQAAAYFQAAETKRAIEAYQKAKGLAKPGIQKEILSYNLGSSYLEDGQYRLATQEFERLLDQKDQLPDYLFKKCCYNLLLSYLFEEEALLKKEEFLKEHLEHGEFLLKKAHDLYSQVSLQDLSLEEGKALWLKLKEAQFLFHKRAELFKQSSLSLEEGIEKLSAHLQDQVHHHEQLGQKKMGSSMTQYFLNKRFILEKKFLPYWKRVEDLLKKEEEKQLLDSQENLGEAKALLNQFQDAQNEYLASLDCLKESLLWQGRLRAAKAEIGLKLIDLFLKKEDAINFCLQKREVLSEKQKKSVDHTAFFSSLNHELKMMHGLTASLIEAQKKALESSNDEPKDGLTLALLKSLEEKVKHGLETSYDSHLYRQVKSNPMDIVYPLYTQLEKKLTLSEASFIKNELRATVERFEIQSKLEKDPQHSLLNLIKNAQTHFMNHENALCLQQIENFLMSLDAEQFISKMITELKSQYEHLLSAPGNAQTASGVYQNIEKMRSLQDKTNSHLNSEKQMSLIGGLERIHEAVKISESSKVASALFLDEGYQWTYRLKEAFSACESDPLKLLQKAVFEQKHALKLCMAYPQLDEMESAEDQALYKISVHSQMFPVAKAKECEGGLKKLNAPHKVKFFKLGLKAAERAKDLLKQEVVAWDEVQSEQKKALKFWEDVFQNDSSDHSNQKSSSKEESSKGQSSQQTPTTANLESQNTPSEKEEKKDLEKIMGVLEKLQEMQQEDKIINKKSQNPKKGLRPW